MALLRILADDLTGALDSAAAFPAGIPVFIDRPSGGYENSPLAVVSSPTRDVPVERLSTYLLPVLDWLTSAGLAFKKVDSLLRGNTFAEIAWLCREGGFDQVVFAPAFPAQGRITTDNRQWVVAADGSRRPVAEPLREAFERFGLGTAASRDAAGKIWIPEVTTDSDLDRIAGCSRVDDGKKRLWCGSAGLAHAFSRMTGVAPGVGDALPPAKGKGPTVLVSSSFQPIFREQWAALRSVFATGAMAEQGDDCQIDDVLCAADNGAEQIGFDLSPRRKIATDEAASRLSGQLRKLVSRLPVPGQLLVVGGDTLLGLCRETHSGILLTQPSIRSGWGCARLIGGRWDGVPCHSRSGAFGVEEDLVRMVEKLGGSGERKEYR